MNQKIDQRQKRDAAATRQRLLDTAEALFADKGYHAVSMRDIARRAAVNLASANYHFGSKERLFVEALIQRAHPLNERRLAALATLERGPKQPTLAQVLDAFARSMVEAALGNEETGKRLHRLLSRAFAESDEIARVVFREEMLPVAMRFLNAIRRACPCLTEAQAGLGLTLYAGCVVHTLRWAISPPIPELKAAAPSEDIDGLMASLVAFGTAGFKKLAAPAKEP